MRGFSSPPHRVQGEQGRGDDLTPSQRPLALQQLAKVKIASTVFSPHPFPGTTEQARCCSAPLASDLSWYFVVREISYRRKCS